MSRVKLLIAGDLHLGRVSSRIATADDAEVSARLAWDRIVDLALRAHVDLLCLTGDVADESNRFWEAMGALERGIRRLAADGILTLAVSGNHDYDALPRLADQLNPDAFRLLGRGGQWERYTHWVDGEPVLHVDGWSFPQVRVRTSPLESYEPERDAATPSVAMVHGDLDVHASLYAPLSRQELLASPVQGWMLGHIHAPMIEAREGRPFLVYPGSPQALDPGEPGRHGIVMAEFEHGRCTVLEPTPVSTVRYDRLDVDVTGIEDDSALARRIRAEVEDFAARASVDGGGALRHLSLRLTLVGRTALAADLRKEATRLEADFEATVEGVTATVEQVRLRVLPAIDMESLARTTSPPGMLARLLLELQSDKAVDLMDEGIQRLVRAAAIRVGEQRQGATFSGIPDAAANATDSDVRAVLCEQAEAMLTQLVDQHP